MCYSNVWRLGAVQHVQQVACVSLVDVQEETMMLDLMEVVDRVNDAWVKFAIVT